MMEEYSQYRDQTAAETVYEASHSLLQLGQHALTSGATNDEPDEMLIASRLMDKEPRTKVGINEVVDRLTGSKSKSSDDTAAKNQNILKGTDNKNENPLMEVRNRLDASIKLLCNEAENLVEGKIDWGRDKLGLCSKMDTMFGKNSHTGNCSEAGIMGEENYHTCGGCGQTFDHICKLHQHLIGHSSGGSYHYDNHIRTAFPKYDMVCKEVQTEEFNIPLVSKRRKRKLVLDNCDVPLLKKVGRVSKKRTGQKARVSSTEINNSNTSKLAESVIRRSKINTKDSQPRMKVDVESLCTKKSTEPDPDVVDEQDKIVEETIDSSINSNTSNRKIDRKQVDLEDISDYEDDDYDDNGDRTDSIGHNFQDTVNNNDSEDEDNDMMYNFKKIKTDSTVFEEMVGRIFNDGQKVNAKVTQGHEKVVKTKKCSVEKRVHSLQSKNKGKKCIVDTFKCKICYQEYNKKRNFHNHVKKIHLKDFPFTCITCSAPFESNAELRKHRKSEHLPVYSCELCSKVLSSRSMLEGHLHVHMGTKPFSCDICKREFRRETQLKVHLQTHSSEKNYQCEFCGKPFSARYLMVGHAKNCGGLKPYKCADCDIRCLSDFALQRHRRVHTGEKPYVCEICAFACSLPVRLKVHMRIHTGERPYACPHCTKTFAVDNTLRRHLVTHTKEKAFVCSYCSKAFTARSSLRVHVRQHTGETPYKCATCGMGFRQNVSLKTHIKSHHQLIASQQESTVPRQLVTVQETMTASAVQRTEWNPNGYS